MRIEKAKVVWWCTIHEEITVNTAESLLPYCRTGVALREPCTRIAATVTWEVLEDDGE